MPQELPKRWPLVIAPENRASSTNKDARLVNCYMEKQENGEYFIYKRSGTTRSSQPSGGTATGRGMWNWLGDIYAVFGTTLYKNGVSLGTVNGAGGVYRFDSCLGATPKLQLGNGVKAYNYDAGAGLVLINDPDFPASFCKGWAYIDGTSYVLRPDAGIQGDDINTPVDWDPLNVIIAQISPDRGVAMAKQLVYAVAMKQWSSEVFYDAGNATGSPLGPVQGARVSFGCINADSVQSIDDILLWVCTNQSMSTQVIKLENLKAEIISTYAIERLLAQADLTACYTFQLKNVGHRFYVLTLTNNNLTLVYDLDEKRWHQWTDASGNYFPFVAATYNSTSHLLQHATDGYIYTMDETVFTDNGGIITVDIYTPNFDAGISSRGKMLSQMKFVSDKTPGSILKVRSNDNDYQVDAWSNFREVDLNQSVPLLDSEGTFEQRAYNFRHQKATGFRMQAVELQMQLCTL